MLGLGLFAWLAVIARIRISGLLAFVGGGVAALFIGALADRWGYGAWVFPPWNYFHVNIVQGVAATQFGREPFFAYFYLLPAQLYFAITLVLMAGMIAMWLRNPRHPLSWATLPFVILHVLVAHKEARFLFPLAIVATAFPVLGFSPGLPRWRGAFTRIWRWKDGIAGKAVAGISVVGMVYFALYPFGVRPHMPMAQYLYRHPPGVVYSFDEPFQSYPLYRPANFRTEKLRDSAHLEQLLAQGPVLLMSQVPVPHRLPPDARATLIYSEFPLARLGYGQAGARYIEGYDAFAARHGWLKLLPLYWYSLYRVERSEAMRS
jgi:phosphatidylinositol glycan class B